MKKFFFITCMCLLAVTGCRDEFLQNSQSLPNPASENCVTVGGTLKILDSPEGQYGICIFRDWSVCEEWEMFRKECKSGDCKMQCLEKDKKSGWYDCKGNLLFLDTCIPAPSVP